MGPDPGQPAADLLHGAAWECARTEPGGADGPHQLACLSLHWRAAPVPGTVAGAWRQAGLPECTSAELDGSDWWFRCTVPGVSESPQWILELDGLATVADVWLNGDHMLRSESMFRPHRVPVELRSGENRLAIRFAALAPILAGKRPRPRWKTAAATNQNLRWLRTTLLGRQPGWTVTPAPVGPWRGARLVPPPRTAVVDRRILARCVGSDPASTTGDVSVELTCVIHPDRPAPSSAHLIVAGARVPLSIEMQAGGLVLHGGGPVGMVERWWPHTHGQQALYPAEVELDDERLPLGRIGFRRVDLDRVDGRFQVSVNGVPLFCRGACWYPLDPVTFSTSDGELRATLLLLREAGMNMVRIPGATVYEEERFFDLCDELGIMVWQDAMLGFLDPPDEPSFDEAIIAELTEVLARVASHPSLTMICGGQELEEQPAMFGLSADRWHSPVAHERIRELAGLLAPGVPYLSSSPSGGDLPFQVDQGVSHYTGVGVFLRPLDDMRRADPKFVSEGLAFAIPPERATVEDHLGGARQAGHDPAWKQAIHHDTGGSWDLEDVRDHYVGVLFGEDASLVRRSDPERALDLGRAAVVQIMAEGMAEWRRTGSPCAGLVLLAARDLRGGAGWGVIDALGRPKAPWFALARAGAPVAVLLTDEGLNGLAIHLVNDTATGVSGVVEVGLCTAEHQVEEARCPVWVPARDGITLNAASLFDGFRDVTYAYRFGPRPYELVTVRLVGEDGTVISQTSFLPGGLVRPVQIELGLQAEVRSADDGAWTLHVSSRRFAQFVNVDCPGFRPANSWFHLPPGGTETIALLPEQSSGPAPRGQARALNSAEVVRFSG